MNTPIDTRQRLLNSARDLLHSRSYGHVGVKEICDMAGVQKGSFYHFFPSKQELTLAVLDEFYLIMKEAVFAQAFRPELSPMQRLSVLMENMYALQKTIKEQSGKTLGCPYGNIASELSTQDEPIRQRLANLFQQMAAALQATLDEAVSKGEIAPCDTAATASAMFAYMEGLMLLAKTRNDPEVIRELGSAMLGIRIETHPTS
ncbi:TetR/AcrR family transcriptional regulator [Thiothrix lacustris]|uniref:TetR/AcrR family transcriptional regulator n=1 Tax=Thiothrix lacustris TaxID=525917 RepID=UPI0027E3B8CF|nr:TetR/AcrR family transcriptional regulator [Thiothrix lacustris]WMP19056.1 TetR/AcrR family transcriptional regulator [Thiothrix lacustris]